MGLYLSIDFDQWSIIQWVIQGDAITMTPDQTVKLINLLTTKRNEQNLSVNEVARRAGVDTGTVWRIEQGMIAKPRVESLIAIAKVLGIKPMELFTTVGWLTADDLPDIDTYLHTKYADLPKPVVENAQRYIDSLRTPPAQHSRGCHHAGTIADPCPQRTNHCPQCPCAPQEY
ncbi:helix-turn-helix domain-containing protein [Gordonia bronchialis]|uniref:helix-turn-helix domain-containing protein n=1 Tax=Gordonia bronchialis TaxID=2054 RepID=UPI001E4B7B91|nr:helix-turn-helix domain-containing protein [Gordonia bronchialis]